MNSFRLAIKTFNSFRPNTADFAMNEIEMHWIEDRLSYFRTPTKLSQLTTF